MSRVRKIIKKSMIALGVLLLLFAGLVVVTLYPQWANMKSEYVTAGVIGDVDAFVTAHPGEWPKSWGDLGQGKDYSAHSRVSFELSVADILRNPALMDSAVMPLSGRYLTYPHAKELLARVLRKLQDAAVSPP